MNSPYVILGVAETATDAEIKAAFRALAKKFHPDVNKDNPKAEEQFKSINAAFDQIKDAESRKKYAAKQNFGYRNPSHRDPRRGFGDVDFDEILNNLFRQSRNYYPNGKNYSEPLRNKDVMLNYSITVEEAYSGKEVELRYNVTNTKDCRVRLKIPPNSRDGIEIRFNELGDDAHKGVKRGNLIVVLRQAKGDKFSRQGDAVYTSVNVDYLDAIMGTTIAVPCIDGSVHNLAIPAGVEHGSSFVISGKGFLTSRGYRDVMRVVVLLKMPKLTPYQLEIVQSIKAAQ